MNLKTHLLIIFFTLTIFQPAHTKTLKRLSDCNQTLHALLFSKLNITEIHRLMSNPSNESGICDPTRRLSCHPDTSKCDCDPYSSMLPSKTGSIAGQGQDYCLGLHGANCDEIRDHSGTIQYFKDSSGCHREKGLECIEKKDFLKLLGADADEMMQSQIYKAMNISSKDDRYCRCSRRKKLLEDLTCVDVDVSLGIGRIWITNYYWVFVFVLQCLFYM